MVDVLTRMRVDQGPNGPASAGGGRSCPRVAGNSSVASVVSSVGEGEGVGVGAGVGLALRTQTSLPRFFEQVKTCKLTIQNNTVLVQQQHDNEKTH